MCVVSLPRGYMPIQCVFLILSYYISPKPTCISSWETEKEMTRHFASSSHQSNKHTRGISFWPIQREKWGLLLIYSKCWKTYSLKIRVNTVPQLLVTSDRERSCRRTAQSQWPGPSHLDTTECMPVLGLPYASPFSTQFHRKRMLCQRVKHEMLKSFQEKKKKNTIFSKKPSIKL